MNRRGPFWDGAGTDFPSLGFGSARMGSRGDRSRGRHDRGCLHGHGAVPQSGRRDPGRLPGGDARRRARPGTRRHAEPGRVGTNHRPARAVSLRRAPDATSPADASCAKAARSASWPASSPTRTGPSWPRRQPPRAFADAPRRRPRSRGANSGPAPNSAARLVPSRGHSSVGRAPALQAGGRRFDPGWLHPTKAPLSGSFSLQDSLRYVTHLPVSDTFQTLRAAVTSDSIDCGGSSRLGRTTRYRTQPRTKPAWRRASASGQPGHVPRLEPRPGSAGACGGSHYASGAHNEIVRLTIRAAYIERAAPPCPR